MGKICIIGMGPGTKEYLPPAAKRGIDQADCLIGAKRLLDLVTELNKEKIRLEGNFNEVLAFIEKNKKKKKIAVLVSGDPGLYSFLGQLSRVLGKEEYTVIPGLSAVQVAFAKIGENWQDVKIISLHGRAPENLLEEVAAHPKIFLFTDPDFSPGKIAAHLLNGGIANRKAIVFENMSYPDERIVDTDLNSLSKMKGFGLCVMIIKE